MFLFLVLFLLVTLLGAALTDKRLRSSTASDTSQNHQNNVLYTYIM